MQRLASDVLNDEAYRVVEAEPGEHGVAWLRGQVVRFCEGDDHARRRKLTQDVIDMISDAPFIVSTTRSLLAALSLPDDLAADVALVSTAYQPYAPQSADADLAADRLVAACGGRNEAAAARACVLVQADAASAALVERMRSASDAPPLAATRRLTPAGEQVEVSLSDAHFGRGRHRCPGEALAIRLASQGAAQKDAAAASSREQVSRID